MADCQDCAISLGTFIDQNEGEGTGEVALLESYCELLYRINITLTSEDIVYTYGDGESTQTGSSDMGSGIAEADDVACKDCDESASCANDADHTESVNVADDANYMKQLNAAIAPLEPLTQIVFMPCEAELWGCMEALWRQASEDPSCEVYVVPIPFCVNTPQGQSIKLCYRQEHFPSYVKITPHTEFSLETERPDKIYIHNAFDDEPMQMVNVEEKYYSWNLKKYTDELVYVCYLIRDEKTGLPPEYRALPAYQNVDQILVSNDVMKDELVTLGEIEEVKVVVRDPLMCKNRWGDVSVIPKEWKEEIGEKKVVFYHGSLEKLFVPDRKALRKTKSVLESFVGKDDLIVIWRPYPLAKDILSYIDPEAAQEYVDIKKWFVDNHVGILDESMNCYNYINMISGCIGEKGGGSEELICRMSIPSMMIDDDVSYDLVKEQDYRVRISDAHYEDEKIWFVADPYGLICEMELITGKVKIIHFIQEEDSKLSGYGRYGGIAKVEHKIVISPHYARAVLSYDVENQLQCTYNIEAYKDKRMNFTRIVLFDKYAYLIPKQFEAIIKIDLETETWNHCDSFMKEVKNITNYLSGTDIFLLGVEKENNILWLFSALDDYLLEFNMLSEKHELRRIGVDGYKTFSSLSCGDNIYLFPFRDNKIVIWNKKTGKCKTVEDVITDYLSNGMIKYAPFCGGALNRDRVMCFPSNKHPILTLNSNGEILDLPEESIFQSSNPLSEEQNKFMNINYGFVKQIHQTGFITFRFYDNVFFWAVDQNSEIQKAKCTIPSYEIEKVIMQRVSDFLYSQEMRIQETQELPLESFLLFLSNLGKTESGTEL
jgi:hypothetical protein